MTFFPVPQTMPLALRDKIFEVFLGLPTCLKFRVLRFGIIVKYKLPHS